MFISEDNNIEGHKNFHIKDNSTAAATEPVSDMRVGVIMVENTARMEFCRVSE